MAGKGDLYSCSQQLGLKTWSGSLYVIARSTRHRKEFQEALGIVSLTERKKLSQKERKEKALEIKRELPSVHLDAIVSR